jgi:hypothetical membrane protein
MNPFRRINWEYFGPATAISMLIFGTIFLVLIGMPMPTYPDGSINYSDRSSVIYMQMAIYMAVFGSPIIGLLFGRFYKGDLK